MSSEPTHQGLLKKALDLFQDRIPFHRTLGFQIILGQPEAPESQAGAEDRRGVAENPISVRFDYRDEFVGNFVRGALHGGVISAVLDSAGGLVAFLSLLEKFEGDSDDAKIARLANIGTIDLRVDYLRSGIGKSFYATGHVLRSGNKVAVTRMELRNDEETLIAVGTGTYLIG